MQENQNKYLNDRPVREDEIGHYKIISDQLYEAIHCNIEKPFVIGLFGSWGIGKSSIIEMLESRCDKENNKTKVIIIDAWRKEKDVFNRQFLKKIARELFGTDKRYENVRKTVDEIETSSKSSWKPSTIAWIIFILFVLAFVLCSYIAISGWYQEKGEVNPFPYVSVTGSIIGILVACYFQLLLPRFSIGINTNINDISVHDIDHFRKIYFDKIIAKTKEECVCIVIDNLDRVEAQDALAIIKTLKTFIVDAKEDKGTEEEVEEDSLNKVVFIIPCDDTELKSHIQESKTIDKDTEFLEKIFNVTFRIPEFREQDAFQYARTLLNEMCLGFNEEHNSTICHVISRAYRANPRKVKIFLNNFLMYYNVASACEKAGKIDAGVITKHPDWLAIYIANEDKGTNAKSYFERLKKEINPGCEVAMQFLKKPNDFDLIENFEELLKLACQNENIFTTKLLERASQSQEIIDAIWRNISDGDTISQVNTVASVICAIQEDENIIISPYITDKMALLVAREYPQYLKNMSGKIVYKKLLKNKPNEILNVIRNFGHNINGIKCSKEKIQYCVDIIEAVLKDIEEILRLCQADTQNEFKKEIPQVIERLANSDDSIVPIAIKYPEYKSTLIFNKSIERCAEGYFDISPDDIIQYCDTLVDSTKENMNYISRVIKCFDSVLRFFQDKKEWISKSNKEVDENSILCNSFLKALRRINQFAYQYNLTYVDSENALKNLNELYDFVDVKNKLEIIEIYKEYENFEKWTRTANYASNFYDSIGKNILEKGSENLVISFMKENSNHINLRLHPYIIKAGSRFYNVCCLVLDEYPQRRNDIISGLYDTRSAWINEWIKNNAPKMTNIGKHEIQNILINVANQLQYPIKIYEALSYLRIGNYKKALDLRNKHFDNIIKSQELSTIEGLEFVLSRIDKAQYQISNKQNELLKNGWREIDQRTAGKELKQFVKEIITT